MTVRAHNAHGWGPESDYLEIVAAEGPETPDPPTTTIQNHYVKIEWTEPYENSAPVNKYAVYIGEETGLEFLIDTIYCDGSQEPVLSNHYCEIPMSTLRLDPYYLAFNQDVLAKVEASNIYGDSGISGVSLITAKIQTEPQQVKNLVKISTTSQANIDFMWDPLETLEETGGTDILSYNVQWDSGTDGYQFLHLVGYAAIFMETEYSISSHIEVGKSYQVRIAAKNYWGWGSYSEILTITAASFPEQVSQPSTGIDEATGGLRVEWTEPFNNSAAVTAYLIEA